MPDTVDDAVRAAAARLAAAGIGNARREARWLAAQAAGSDDRAAGTVALTPAAQAAFEAMVARRAAHEPLQHILGTTEFFGLDLATDSRALIPRADSECVVAAALRLIPETAPAHIADLGTGSGCLLLALLSWRPEASGIGIDASAEAIALARENAARTGLAARARMVCQTWEAWQGWGEADLVISNPPYIRTGDIADLDADVRDFEPRAALDGGPDGLAAYHSLARLGAAQMKPGAWLVLETGYDQLAAVAAILAQAGFEAPGQARDLGGRDRVIWARRP